MAQGELDRLTRLLGRLPGLGPRSARRIVLFLMKRREGLLLPLAEALTRAAEAIQTCQICGNLDDHNPCAICTHAKREHTQICVVEEVGDLWALERSGAYRGCYHVLGGTLSALDGRGPEQLAIDDLIRRVAAGGVSEVILALSATVEGQTTGHYLAERLDGHAIQLTRLAQGVPVGGTLDYLDDGTLTTALRARRTAR